MLMSPKNAAEDASGKHVGTAATESEALDEVLTSVAVGSVAQVVLASAAVLAVCYVASLVMMTLATSLLLAFILEPMVGRLERWHVPRPAGAFVAVMLLLGCMYGVVHFSYNNAVAFISDVPKYADKLRATTLRFRQQAEQLQQTTETVLPESQQAHQVVRVRQQSTWIDWLTNSASSLTELLVALSFMPFLIYFMLSWKERTHLATVQLFKPEHRRAADATFAAMATMLRSFLVGNLLCGLFVASGCIVAFGLLHIPYFYFLGFLSGFLSLIPYLGTILAMLPPLAAGLDTLSGPGMIAIGVIVFSLDMFAISVLFPKVIGKRLKLNPLVVTVALLIWGWIWGAMGLILAIPITGAMKIIFDHIDTLRPFGAWLEE
jgi:predicted PurR-regulated permease PerM